jgi:hypothetical protein
MVAARSHVCELACLELLRNNTPGITYLNVTTQKEI